MTFNLRMPLLAMAGALTITASAALADPVWDRIESTGTVVCGAIPNDPIGSWVDRETGRWEGYEVDLCRAIVEDLSEEMGQDLEVEFRETSWANIVLDLQSQKIDIWPGMSATEERKKALSMVGPMYNLAFCAMDGKNSDVGTTWEALNSPDVRIATVTGTSVEAAFKKMAPEAEHISLAKFSEITLAVQSGRADVMGADVLRCLNVINEAPNVFNSIFFPTPVQSMGSSAGLLRSSDRLTEWLTGWSEEHKADGTIKEIFLNVLDTAGYDPDMVPPEVQF